MLPLLALVLCTPPDYHAEALAAIAIAKAKRERESVKAVEPVAKTGYPVRGNWWTGCPDWTHLTTGIHANKFPSEWLQTLSNAEVQSLHSDSHEGRVKWEYIPTGKQTLQVQSKAESYVPMVANSSCPGGNCPQSSGSSYRPGLLGRIFR